MDTLKTRIGLRVLSVLLTLLVATEAFDVARPTAQGIVFGPGPGGAQASAVDVPPCQFGDVSRDKADARVSTRGQLESALAAGGRLIWIENSAAIDLAIADHRRDSSIDYVLQIPSNVTLASGRSPTQLGGMLYFSRQPDRPRFMLALSSCSRVTGLRLRGPSRSTARNRPPTTALWIRRVSQVRIDNNELSDWPGAGVEISQVPNTYQSAHAVRITGNFFHHNLMCGSGYGVVLDGNDPRAQGGYAFIDRNVFDYNRHHIAGDGHPKSGYLAQHNLVLSGGRRCYNEVPGDPGYYEQHFDMHGFNGEREGYGGDAGEFITIRYNTVRGDQRYYLFETRPVFMLRGTPTGRADFYGNVLAHDDRSAAIKIKDGRWDDDDPRLRDWNNQYNVDTSHELVVGDFDGDGIDDVFQATGTVWVFSARGRSDWRVLNTRSERLSRLLFGDFNGDRKTDVFTQQGTRWLVSYGGSSAWTALPFGSSVPMSTYRIGDFDGDGKADVFRTTGSQWLYSKGGAEPWERLAGSAYRESIVRFGDFNGDGATDVFGLVGGAWKVAYGGSSGWQQLNNLISSNLNELVFADLDGDGITDVGRQKGADYQVSWRGTAGWSTRHHDAVTSVPLPLTTTLLGDFTGDGAADILHYERSIVAVGDHFVISGRGDQPFVTWSRHEMR